MSVRWLADRLPLITRVDDAVHVRGVKLGRWGGGELQVKNRGGRI